MTGVPLGLLALWAMIYSHISFAVMFAIITMLTVNELCNLVHEYKKTNFSTLLAVLGGGYLFLALYATSHLGVESCVALYAPYILLLVYTFIRQLYRTEGSSLDNYAYFVLTQVYAALPFALLNILSTAGEVDGTYNFVPVLSVFIFIWSNDTGAFFVGCSIGRHKMWERVSPKKTWEGTIGGILIAMLAGYIISLYSPLLNAWQWMGMAVVIAATGTYGDLIESCMKREMGIKDSGTIIPGHGGLLDRFDSTIVAVPSALIYLSLIGVL